MPSQQNPPNPDNSALRFSTKLSSDMKLWCHLCRNRNRLQLLAFTGLRNFGGWTCICTNCADDLGLKYREEVNQDGEDGGMEPCCECGEYYPRPDLVDHGHVFCARCRDERTVAQVIADRKRPGVGCCNDYADRKSCDCLERARDKEQGGRPAGTRQYRRGIDGCPICGDPNCPDYGQKH